MTITDKQVSRIAKRIGKKAQIDDRWMEVRDKLMALVETYQRNYPEDSNSAIRQEGVIKGLETAIRYIEELA